MKVYYVSEAVVDCTSDPHPVEYDALPEMLEDVVRVCESEMVMGVRSVHMTLGGEGYESDRYDESDYGEKRKFALSDIAKKHKVYGLYFHGDAKVPGDRHLPPGLTGVKAAVEKALENPSGFGNMCIGVVWAFVGQSSCSDYIEVPCEYDSGAVNYGSQDWWIGANGYEEWCQQMADFLQRPFKYSDGIKEPQ